MINYEILEPDIDLTHHRRCVVAGEEAVLAEEGICKQDEIGEIEIRLVCLIQ